MKIDRLKQLAKDQNPRLHKIQFKNLEPGKTDTK